MEFWCFGLPPALGRGQVGGGHGGCPSTHAHAHTHLYMYRNCKWPPTWRHPCLTCMYVHACMHGTSPHTPIPTPTPIHPSATPRGVDPRNHLKFDNTSTYQDISIPFEDLKSVKNSPRMGGCVVGWVDGWGQVKSLKI